LKKLFILTFFLFVGTVSCNLLGGGNKQSTNENKTIENENTVLESVLENKELRVVVDYNSTNYFIYRGQPMGFQYELLRQFANHLNVDLKIYVSNDLEETFEGLNNSDYDLVAKNLTVTTARNKIVDFTEPLALTRQVLVQRKYNNPENTGSAGTENELIREQLDLAGKTVYVQKNTVFVQRLKHLSEEIGEPIKIVEDTIYGVEQLVALVASGEIDYTVCDENVGLVNKKYYPWIDVETPISFNQKLSWAVQKNNADWKEYIDSWIVDFKKTSTYNVIYNKYFSGYRNTNIVRSDYHSITGGKISDYDEIIRDVALHNNWDWRLIASIIMQESNFDTYAESWMGALGLMQLMPQTASQYDVEDYFDPQENIRGGIEHLNWLREVFNPIIEDDEERLKFILASYNVGIGHVMDARKLAMKYGLDPLVWKDNVDIFILKKSIPQYYNDPVVKWGYCRGEEPYNYVIKILDRYHQYVNILPDENNIALVSLPVLQSSLR
jgi:membrane-bound lytic murein transglycosylase F